MSELGNHWALSAAKKTIAEHGDQDVYTCASGITPSGVIHIGNFREAITVDLVTRAFRKLGLRARHIHSWDNNDVFRKVPKDMPQELSEHLRKCIMNVPDPQGVHKSYAEKHMAEVEATLPLVGILPEYLDQYKKYRSCEYAEQIKKSLEYTKKIKEITDDHRAEPHPDDWLPVSIFCDSCGKDTIRELSYKGGYELCYSCTCGHCETFDFRDKGIVKLVWRVDWPMRWQYENVNFEPGGKDHSTVGGSYDTGKRISQEVFEHTAPTYLMYDFIRIKGLGGKISSSKGGVVTLRDVLEVYEPQIARYLFVSTRPNAEFDISFDADVIKIYEDYDKCERIAYGVQESKEKEREKQHIIYEFSQVKEGWTQPTMPLQVPFRTVTMQVQINGLDVEKTVRDLLPDNATPYDEEKLTCRVTCAKNWVTTYADEQFRFAVKEKQDQRFIDGLSEQDRILLEELKIAVSECDDEESLSTAIFDIPKKHSIAMTDFFCLCYQAIIGKDKGPKLAGFILNIGRERILKLL